MNLSAMILSLCAAAMFYLGARRFRAGQKSRALWNWVMALFMALFAVSYLG